MKPSTHVGNRRVDGVGKREQLFASRSEGDAVARWNGIFWFAINRARRGRRRAGMTEEEEGLRRARRDRPAWR